MPAKAGTHPETGLMFYVYLLASESHETLCVGMTDELIRRIAEHKAKLRRGFTAKYGVDRLIWFEAHEAREPAWQRERQLRNGDALGRSS